MTARPRAGFTLIEVLVSLALLGVLLTAFVSLNIGTTRSATALQTRNDLLSELQITQNYLAVKLKNAAYIFPGDVDLKLAEAEKTTTNYARSGQVWKTGTDPILAFILPPPTVKAGQCAKESSGGEAAKYCYAFYAIYAMKRSDFRSAVASTNSTDDPGPNPANPDALVLLEYRGYYKTGGYQTQGTDIPTGNQGRLLMDYLAPQDTTAPGLFGVNTGSGQVAGETTVTLRLAALQQGVGQVVRIPSSDPADFSTLTIYPRNVGKPVLSN